jgi:hypothetical protein
MLSRFSVINMAQEKADKEKRLKKSTTRIFHKTNSTGLSEEICNYMLGLGNLTLTQVLQWSKLCWLLKLISSTL